MTSIPNEDWIDIFPGPRVPDVLEYVAGTWSHLQKTVAPAVGFCHGETDLTDNLCEALENAERRRAHRMDCDFQAETWELRRNPDGTTSRIARADIRVMLGVPGTPHLVIEFKKLDGTADNRWRYCFDGVSRFVEGKYSIGHSFGVMCGLTPRDLDDEANELAAYVAKKASDKKLRCIVDTNGDVVTVPSILDPLGAKFETNHDRTGVGTGTPILILHTLLSCPYPPT